jgi:hypothetical protein
LDVSEPFSGDGWVQQLVIGAAQVGQVYFLLVDNWTGNSNPFTLDWTLAPVNILDCTPPLPVEMLNFEAYPNQQVNDIFWTTASEVNSDHFVIEKSNDAINYYELGRTTAAGNSNTMLDYSFVDQKPYAVTYYRIRQVDKNGQSKTYGPMVVNNENASGLSLENVYPNPANESFFVDVYSKEAVPVDIFVYDSYGKLVHTEMVEIEGKVNHEIQSSDWASGIYVIKMINESHGFNEVRRVIIN